MKQYTLFGGEEEAENKYSSKIKAPIYEPKQPKPDLFVLCDDSKSKRLIREIESSDITEDEKKFLATAAHRHTVFHYERIADYYAQASEQMQRLMEESALVIVDFESAIENGYVMLSEDIKEQFLEERPDEL